MKTKILRFVLIAASVVFAVGCSDDEKVPDSVALPEGMGDVVFTPDDTADKNVSFTASASWRITLEPAQTAWVEITPPRGKAGEATVTVRLVEQEAPADRSVTALIEAGDAKATFQIEQKARPLADRIAIKAPALRLPVGAGMTLAIEYEPEGAKVLPVSWGTSDPAVLTVDEDGAVTAVAAGTAVVKATMTQRLTAELTVEVTEEFITDGTGREYTFADLGELEFSGVEAAGQVYTLTRSLTVAEEDVLVLGDGEQLRIAPDVQLRVEGMVDFAPATSASVGAVDPADVEAIYFTGDVKGGGTFRNVAFDGVQVRCFGVEPMTFEKCSFTGVQTNSSGALSLGGNELVTVSECRFIENNGPAITGGANVTAPLVFKDNYLYKNSKTARNRPHINVTVAGNGKVEIVGNTVIGPGEVTTCGGIAVSNMLGIGGTNQVLIEGNKVSDCRFGITTNGTMNVRIIDNVLENNKWDSNPMTGGSGVSISNMNGGQKIFMRGNTIKGHLWGITNIGSVAKGKGPELNLGNLTQGDDYNPGGNVFADNGNGGVLYDLYNNSPTAVMAQGNKWNVAVQDEASIETVIYHKPDDATLGEVTFMPAAQQ